MGVIGGGEDDGAGMSAVLLLEHSARGRVGVSAETSELVN
jgi:hypothetical protein